MNKKLQILLNKPVMPFEKFHSKTNIKKLNNSLMDPKLWPAEWKKIAFKGYSRLDEIKLVRPILANNISLKKTLFKRVSVRTYTYKRVSIKKLSTLLYFTAGLKKEDLGLIANRFYPSAGARYPLEVYILSFKTDLTIGLYHYYIKNHSLEMLSSSDSIDLNFDLIFNQEWIKKASFLIFITARFKRNTNKYADRGYRYILMEAGHMGQNIYLLTEALGLGCCAIGGFVDGQLNKLLDIDGVEESILCVYAVGSI